MTGWLQRLTAAGGEPDLEGAREKVMDLTTMMKAVMTYRFVQFGHQGG